MGGALRNAPPARSHVVTTCAALRRWRRRHRQPPSHDSEGIPQLQLPDGRDREAKFKSQSSKCGGSRRYWRRRQAADIARRHTRAGTGARIVSERRRGRRRAQAARTRQRAVAGVQPRQHYITLKAPTQPAAEGQRSKCRRYATQTAGLARRYTGGHGRDRTQLGGVSAEARKHGRQGY